MLLSPSYPSERRPKHTYDPTSAQERYAILITCGKSRLLLDSYNNKLHHGKINVVVAYTVAQTQYN